MNLLTIYKTILHDLQLTYISIKVYYPRNIKMHNMETRQPDVFKVQHANTERLLQSSIIYMQNLLNDDFT